MNLALLSHQLRQKAASFCIWTAALCGIIVTGMAFFPVLSQRQFVDQIGILFEHPFFNTAMKMFGVNMESLTKPMGFYLAYLSIYTVLAAMIYTVFLASDLILQEMKERTFEYLLARPLSRAKVFLTKVVSLFILVTSLVAAMYVTGRLSLSAFSGGYPGEIRTRSAAYEKLVSGFRANPEAFRDYFGFTEEDYTDFLLTKALSQIDSSPQLVREAGIDPAMIGDLLAELENMESPEELFEKVRRNPLEFIEKYNLPVKDTEELLSHLEQTEEEYRSLLDNLLHNPVLYVEVFQANPDRYAAKVSELAGDPALASAFGLQPGDIKRVIRLIDTAKFILLHINLYVILLFMPGLVLLISLLAKRSQTVLGISIGLILASYLIHGFSKVVPELSIIGNFSPFGLIPTDSSALTLSRMGGPLIVFTFLGAGFYSASYLLFRRKDITG